MSTVASSGVSASLCAKKDEDRWSRSWFWEFADEDLERQFKARNQSQARFSVKVLEVTLCISTLLFIAGSKLEVADILYRSNNVISWLFVSYFRRCPAISDSTKKYHGIVCLSWGLHYVMYQSLSHGRAIELCRLIGAVSNEDAGPLSRLDIMDEGYQLLFCSLAISALAMYARMPLVYFFVFAGLAPVIYAIEIIALGTFLSPVNAIKHVFVYTLFCILAALGACQVDSDLRSIFRHDCELAEELAREREWHRCFGRILASNFDYSTTLGPDLKLDSDMRLNAMLGTVMPSSMHIVDLANGPNEQQRLAKFFDNLRDQVAGSPNSCHGPERFAFTMGTETTIDVDLQVLWVPGKVHTVVAAEDDKARPTQRLDEMNDAITEWPSGNLWVCLRQRQLEQHHAPVSSSSSDRQEDMCVDKYPDFTVEFEAGSPRFTVIEVSSMSPFERAMRQAPDLMDWLPMRYSESFMVWVEESVTNAPDDAPSISRSFGPFLLQPPCSDWHAIRVQRAILEIPEYGEEDLPVTLRLMGVSQKRRSISGRKHHDPRQRRGTQRPSQHPALSPEILTEIKEGTEKEGDNYDGDDTVSDVVSSSFVSSEVPSMEDDAGSVGMLSLGRCLEHREPLHREEMS